MSKRLSPRFRRVAREAPSPGLGRRRGTVSARAWAAACLLSCALLPSCGGDPPRGRSGAAPSDGAAGNPDPGTRPAPPAMGGDPGRPPRPALTRLTTAQYWNTIEDLFGAGITRTELEQDAVNGGFAAVGAAEVVTSRAGVERYEQAARGIVDQVFGDAARRAKLVGCVPAGAKDPACTRTFVEGFGRRVFRRPLTTEEITTYVDLAQSAQDALADFWAGLGVTASALLQSPKFLFRAEYGQPGAGGSGVAALTSHELASRLSYLLWGSMPDPELLAAADRNELADDAGLGKQLSRMLAHPRARHGLRGFFTEALQMGAKPGGEGVRTPLYPAMREESLRVLEELVFERKADLLSLLTTRRTFVNRELAQLYGLPAPAAGAFAAVELPADGPRVGFLGQGAFLAATSIPDHGSPTSRGKFVRETLLCQTIPPAPPGVNTQLPPLPQGEKLTTRKRLDAHRADPACASCHALMDPIGLTFERFDWQGRHRTDEGGLPIDTTGDLDGAPFADARALADLLAKKPEVSACLARTFFRFAIGRSEVDETTGAFAAHLRSFEGGGRDLLALLTAIVTSPDFRTVTVSP